MKLPIALAASTLMLAASLTACGEDTPAVCGSVADLKASVKKVQDIDLTSSDAPSDLKSGLKAVKSDLTQVTSDAKSEFATQIDAVESGYSGIKTSVEAAVANPSAATVAAVGAALKTLGTDVKTLVNDIEATC